MLEEFKSIDMLKNAYNPYVLDEINILSRNNDGSIESEISNLDQEQRANYCDHVFRNFRQLVETDNDPQKYTEIQECIKKLTILAKYNTFISPNIFLYVVKFASKISSLEDCLFLFKVSSFMQNPSLVSQSFRIEKESIHYFINKFSKPFSQSFFTYWKYIINSSQENCDELIFFGVIDKFYVGIWESILSGQDFSSYWIPSLQLLNEIANNCTIDINIFIAIRDICFMFFDERYPPDLVLPSVECLITIATKIEDIQFFTSISSFLPFFDQILCDNKVIDEVKPIMNLIANISTKFIDIDLYKNEFVQHLIDLSSDWDEKEFEPAFKFLFMILTFTLRHHPKLIIEITKTNLLNLAASYFNDGSCFIKNEILLFFSRLCDDFFWEYVSDFFEENSEIISSLFLILPSNISQKSRLIIIHALTSLATNIHEKEKYMPNIVSQYALQSSIDAYHEVQETGDESILNECNLLNEAVNKII